MNQAMDVFLSNRLEILYQQFKHALFETAAKPLMRRLVMVYGPATKNWLTLRMAQDPELNVAMGMEFIYLGQGFESLLQLSTGKNGCHFPSSLELSLAIETELLSIIHKYPSLNPDERNDWEPLIQHLKLTHSLPDSKASLSRKMEKRLIGLSEQLARLFQDYGRYALEMVQSWEKPEAAGWQPRLWRKLFVEKKGWSYPSIALKQGISCEDFSLNIFSVSFMPAAEFAFLNRLSQCIHVRYYLLSPCAVFWSDIRSDRENAYLENYWKKKLGHDSSQVLKLEELLQDRNPLLANFGRIGREMACQMEESGARMHALYELPEHVQELNLDLPLQDDLILTETKSPLSLLHALQADLLLMRNSQGALPFNMEHEDYSLQVHAAPCRRREVEILYHNLLRLMAEDPSLCPADVIVMAPQIEDYAPFIQGIFGAEQSQLDFQILDLGMLRQSEILQGFLLLLELSDGWWNAGEILQLFGHASFQRCHQLSQGDCTAIQQWIEKAGIHWGDDELHRNELLKQRHCQNGMTDDTLVGTWDYGLSRLMLGLVASQDSQFEVPPLASIDFSDGALLGKWIRLLHALRDDLSPLQDQSRMTISDWVNYLHCLLENYFKPDAENLQSVAEYAELKGVFEMLRASATYIPEAQLTFLSIKIRLHSLLENQGTAYREEHLQAVRFCSLMPLRTIPAQVVAMLGMQEDAFPRVNRRSSLNQMQDCEKCDYCPLSNDFDRYLFLEALHSAQEYLLLSYCGFSQDDNKDLNPSLLVEELFSYLDEHYSIQGRKISEKCLFKHPFDAFDARYFIPGSDINNFSLQDYHAAQAACKPEQNPPHRFAHPLHCFNIPLQDVLPSGTMLNLKQLISVAKDPIKFHFNKTWEMYLESPEERQLKTEEELVISALDRSLLKQESIKEPIEAVLERAEREGKLPFGMFKEVAAKRFKKEVEDLHECLNKHFIVPSDIFEIEFAAHCTAPCQFDDGRWLLPSVVLSYEDGYQLLIIGKIPLATHKGLLVLGKNSLPDIWKVWPQFLLYCSAVKLLPQHLEAQLIPVHSSKAKKTFFDDPQPYLKQFISYYALCLRKFSPLMPDWIPFFLNADAEGLQDKLSELMSDTARHHQNPYHQWIFHQQQLSCTQDMLLSWKERAALLTDPIMQHWFPAKNQEVIV